MEAFEEVTKKHFALFCYLGGANEKAILLAPLLGREDEELGTQLLEELVRLLQRRPPLKKMSLQPSKNVKLPVTRRPSRTEYEIIGANSRAPPALCARLEMHVIPHLFGVQGA